MLKSPFSFHVISGYFMYPPPGLRHNQPAKLFILTAARFRDLMFWPFRQTSLGSIWDQINLALGVTPLIHARPESTYQKVVHI